MQLLYTPLSHFSRKVRILLAGLNLDVELIHVGSTAKSDLAVFGGNPLLSVPVLKDGNVVVLDSDDISEYIVRHYSPDDEFGVLRRDSGTLNARSVMNGVMAAEVELVLAARLGLETHGHPRLDKKREIIGHGLTWLEAQYVLFSTPPNYLSFHLISLWDHLVLFNHMPSGSFHRLSEHVEYLHKIPFIAASKPVIKDKSNDRK